jgi:two-component system, chemotaxis family, protein-glutamate methylesterase/glutaminase
MSVNVQTSMVNGEGARVRILVVDDSAFMRLALSKMIDSDPQLNVVATAHDGLDAIEKVKKYKPDLVTLDIEMPKMDGLTALRRIMSECPTTVIMVSSLTTQGSREALRAMRFGAVDFVAKDASFISNKIDALKDELLSKIKAIGSSTRMREEAASTKSEANPAHSAMPTLDPNQVGLIVIGSSTGGPPVVETIVNALPPDLIAPVVIAQHMPGVFTKSLSERLNAKAAVSVFEGEDGMPLYPGTVYISRGGHQTRIRKMPSNKWSLRVNDQPSDALYKPSVDVLFASAAECHGDRCVCVMLTGMGDDGVIGARAISARGGTVVTQSAATCVVYGMPKAVDDAGVSVARLSPAEICKMLSLLRASASTDSASIKELRKAS